MKRITALGLALLMVLSITACSSGTNTPNNTPNTSGSQALGGSSGASSNKEDPPKSNDIYSWILEENPESISGTVRFWVPFKGTQGMDDMIADFNKTYPNVEVVLTTYNNNAEGNVAVNTAMMAGQIDVLHSFELYNAYARWENGLYMDLTDKIAEAGIDLAANWGNDTCK